MSLIEILQNNSLNKCFTDRRSWANLVVVCSNKSNSKTKFGVFEDGYDTLTNGRLMTKEEIIKEIKDNKQTAITTYIENGNCYRKGEFIQVVANEYLRTDKNDIEEDNLGELPSCDELFLST